MTEKLPPFAYKEIEAEILPVLVRELPLAFKPRGQTVRPLRIGMLHDLEAVLPPEVDRKKLRWCIAYYCGSSRYLREIKAGVARVGLRGEVAGYISAADEASALRRLNGRIHAKPAKVIGADVKGEAVEAPAPTPPPQQAPEPEALSLDTGIPVSKAVATPEPAKTKLKWPKPGTANVKVEKVNDRSARKQTLDEMAAALRAKTEFQAKRNEAIEKLRGAR